GTIQEEEKVKAALITIMESSYTPAFGLRNCTWPEYPDHYPIHETNLWVDQANTCWSGVELAFAALLIYEGLVDQGQAVIQTVDDRYRKSGLYWDHQEFGGHYYRPMSAWSILHAYLGLGISCGCYSFNPHLEQENYRLFFSHGNGTAHYVRLRINFGKS
ncbi:MAG: beta-glucosidase, partial [Bacteroidetes bacterium]|nr:beta-glucosidase [Bacteroidota bacterium]